MDVTGLANVAFAGVALFGAVLTALATLAFRRAPSPRMGLVTSGFALIAVQGAIVSVGLFTSGWSRTDLLAISAVFEAGLLVVLFAATLVR